ncbi:biofilm regulation diguanylate cyclase SiaD [Halomonas organivorans]
MSTRDRALLDEVETLLAMEAHRDHPLHSALSRLYHRHLEQRDRLERLVNIADGFQQSAQQDLHQTRHQLDRQLRRQRKLSRIADRYQDLLHERNQALEDASSRDPLTGLANRRRINHQLKRTIAESERRGRPFSLAMVDIDHFKRINDRYGHAAGDRALIVLAQALESALRVDDFCGRWGGEEFLVVLPNTDLVQAESMVTRLCDRLRDLDLGLAPDGPRVTASVGIAEHRPREDYRDTIRRADRALLSAKRDGRDRLYQAE